MREMSNKELKDAEDAIDRYTKKICSSKKAATKALRDIGLFDKEGNPTYILDVEDKLFSYPLGTVFEHEDRQYFRVNHYYSRILFSGMVGVNYNFICLRSPVKNSPIQHIPWTSFKVVYCPDKRVKLGLVTKNDFARSNYVK